MAFNPMVLINILTNQSINKEEKAYKNVALIRELDNCFLDTKGVVKNLNIEQAIKFTLWNGLLNQYGVFGGKREQNREFKITVNGNKEVRTYNDERFNRGKVLSIDFGVSNIGRELSFTHSGIVIADYVGVVVVVPITSQKEFGLNKLSPDIQQVIIPIYNKDYPQIQEDSYILMHQIRAVSKNRITKVVASLSKMPIMQEIEEKILDVHSPYINKVYKDRISELENEIENLKKLLK